MSSETTSILKRPRSLSLTDSQYQCLFKQAKQSKCSVSAFVVKHLSLDLYAKKALIVNFEALADEVGYAEALKLQEQLPEADLYNLTDSPDLYLHNHIFRPWADDQDGVSFYFYDGKLGL